MKAVVGVLVAALLGYVVGRYLQQPEVVTVIEERQVVIHYDRIIREVIHPDGTKETIIEDHSTEESVISTETVSGKHQWLVEAQLNPKSTTTGYLYGLSVSRRILGPVMVGVFANTDKNIGLSVGVEF